MAAGKTQGETVSWANVALTLPQTKLEASTPISHGELGRSLAILDASAIIGAADVGKYAESLVSTPEVCAECRDKQSLQALAALPFGINIREPTETSVAAVMRFARATGEVHSLSEADIRLIALAHTLEVAAHGHVHLRSEPAQARISTVGSFSSGKLPGWGEVGGDWAVMDQMEEEELAAAERAQGASATSRIAAEPHNLSMSATSEAAASPEGNDSSAVQDATAVCSADAADDVARGGEDGGQWEAAAASQNAARRRRRQQARQAARSADIRPGESNLLAAPSLDGDWSSAGRSPSVGEDDDEDACAHDHAPLSFTEEHDAGDEHESDTREDTHPSIVIVTADFAMQNVILQMGLTLMAPDGRRIHKVSIWVLRCSACFKVTKEMERIFCPSCGNAALQKVEMVVGQDGTEQYGVRKKHIIRGTRYSLPKPKGGKNSNDPILREDMLKQRLAKRKPRVEQKDPFAPQYNSATWFDKGRLPSGYEKGLAATLASWKHNPNERQHTRTNRRK